MLAGMSGSIKVTDNRRPIVEPGGFTWPWSQGGRDLDIGQSAITPGVSFRAPTVEIGPEKKERRPRLKRSPAFKLGGDGAGGKGAGLFGGLAGLIIGFFAVLHAAPHLTGFVGLADLFYDLVEEAPQGPLIAAASRVWAFEAMVVWIMTLALRLIALNAAKTEARGALALAALAALIDGCVWFAVGREAPGDQSALLFLLALEIFLTFGLVVISGILTGQRRRQEV